MPNLPADEKGKKGMNMANKLLLAGGGAFALLVFLALLIGIAFLFSQNAGQKQEIASLQAEENETLAKLSSLQSDYAELGHNYESKKAELASAQENISASQAQLASISQELAQAHQQLATSMASLEEQKQKAVEIAADLNSLETSVSESMAWFTENAKLPVKYGCAPGGYGCKSDLFKSRILSDCVENNNLNLACITYLMESTTFSIHYRTDSVKGKEDHLQGVKETIDVGWGDCEDYSYIFKAAFNSVKESSPGLSAVAFTSGDGNFRVYPKESTPLNELGSYYYVPNAQGISLGSLSSTYPYVICFSYSAQAGHCTVALSPHKITGSSDIHSLNGAQVFESQSGQYLGRVGGDYSICTNQQECFSNPRQIRIVIADGDLYSFVDGEWVSYADYLKKVQDEKAALGSASS